ncbi:MAG: hypothetical protein NTY04_01095, partial [Candidatus Staskawiczbacteria bacterium]|nr:hypothetical protein [Candidatus Staskawiczbacteria bacterium]
MNKNVQKNIGFKGAFFSILSGLITAGLFSFSLYAFATAWPYTPPAPLDPGCSSSDPTCTVKAPLTDNFSTDFSGTGNITTTGTIQGGVINVNGVYTLPTASGTSGQYLKSNGDGTLTWTTISAQDLSGLVPYTGATGAVDLGTHGLTAGAINANNQPLVPAGTYSPVGQANPIIYRNNSGDLNIAGRSDGTNKDIIFRYGGSFTAAMMVQGSTGNIGIGTSAPVNLLDIVKSDGTDPVTFNIQNTVGTAAGSAQLMLGTRNIVGDTNVGAKIKAQRTDTGTSGTTDLFFAASNGASMTERMRIIGSTGNIGIGTVNPVGKLDISESGAKTAVDYSAYITNTSTSSSALVDKYGLYISSTGTWNGTSANNYGLYVDAPTGGTTNYAAYLNGATMVSGGNLTIASGALMLAGTSSPGTVANPLIYRDNSGDLNIAGRSDGTNKDIIFRYGGSFTAAMMVQGSSGNVGVGTSNPGYKLDVNGDVNIASGSHYKINGVNISTGTPGGSDTQIQYNSGNIFAGTSDMTYGNKMIRLLKPLLTQGGSGAGTGTASAASAGGNNYTITGSGTKFTTECAVGSYISFFSNMGTSGIVTVITSDTVMTVSSTSNITHSAATYYIQNPLINARATTGNFVVNQPVAGQILFPDANGLVDGDANLTYTSSVLNAPSIRTGLNGKLKMTGTCDSASHDVMQTTGIGGCTSQSLIIDGLDYMQLRIGGGVSQIDLTPNVTILDNNVYIAADKTLGVGVSHPAYPLDV